MKSLSVLLAVLVTALSPAVTLVNGAGATFPYPLYSKWFTEYQKVDPDTQFNYQSIGSGGGIRQFIDKTIDFGASDAPMTDEQLKKAKAPVLHIPTVIGAVAVTYHLPQAAGLKLNADALADIFLGKIKKWDDPKIKKLNPSLTLSGDVIVTHRSDGSGTTAIFTDYLAKVSPEWKQKVGSGTAVSWPTGLGGKGNEGVAGLVKQTPGAIGYVELIYALSNKLSVASLQNRAGQFIEPSLKAVTAAAQGALKAMPDDYRVFITHAEGKDAYPIAGFTYLLVWKQMSQDKGPRLVKFLQWALKDGQAMAEPLHYAPLPQVLARKMQATIATIESSKMN